MARSAFFLLFACAASLAADVPFFWLQGPSGRNNPHDPHGKVFAAPTPAPTPVLKHPYAYSIEPAYYENAQKIAVDEANAVLYLADTSFINCPMYHPVTGDSLGDFYAYVSPPAGAQTTVEDISIAPNGDRLVCNGYNRVARYDPAMVFLHWIGGPVGFGNGQFNSPKDTAADTVNARVVVADSYNKIVQVLGSGGNFLFQFGGAGSGDGQFNLPHAIGILSGARIAVADIVRQDVQVFDSGGTFLFKFNGSLSSGGAFTQMRDMAVLANHDIMVLESQRLVVFDSLGNTRYEQRGDIGWPKGFNGGALALAVGASGRVYVSVDTPAQIKVYDPVTP